jgi:hypothetical protein
MATKEQLAAEMDALVKEGWNVLVREVKTQEAKKSPQPKQKKAKAEEGEKPFYLANEYQAWYSKALPVVRQLLPDRYAEFQEQYKVVQRKEISFVTYGIADYLIGLQVTRGYEKVVDGFSAFTSKMQHQLSILRSASDRLKSAVADIEGVLQSALFNSELQAAWDLHKKKHLRAAGAVAGVTLEAHLASVCSNHIISFRKANPTIADYNEALKADGVVDTPVWRHIQHLGDVRNMCVHSKDREPTAEEVEDLIRGVERLTGTLF